VRPNIHEATTRRQRVTDQEIEAKVIEIIAQQMGHDKDKIKPEMSFGEDLNADSLDQVELMMELEEAFDTSIPDSDAEKIKTVGDAITFIKKNRAGV
jgi:acyl carrier protein